MFHVQYFSTDGQGETLANVNMMVDGSGTPVVFTINVPTAFETFTVNRLLFHLQATGRFDAEGFANLSALPNGLTITLTRNGYEQNLLGVRTIQQNGHFDEKMFDSDVKTWGTGDEHLTARFSLWKLLATNGSKSNVLKGSDKLEVTIHDDLQAIVGFHVLAQGEVDRRSA